MGEVRVYRAAFPRTRTCVDLRERGTTPCLSQRDQDVRSVALCASLTLHGAQLCVFPLVPRWRFVGSLCHGSACAERPILSPHDLDEDGWRRWRWVPCHGPWYGSPGPPRSRTPIPCRSCGWQGRSARMRVRPHCSCNVHVLLPFGLLSLARVFCCTHEPRIVGVDPTCHRPIDGRPWRQLSILDRCKT